MKLTSETMLETNGVNRIKWFTKSFTDYSPLTIAPLIHLFCCRFPWLVKLFHQICQCSSHCKPSPSLTICDQNISIFEFILFVKFNLSFNQITINVVLSLCALIIFGTVYPIWHSRVSHNRVGWGGMEGHLPSQESLHE